MEKNTVNCITIFTHKPCPKLACFIFFYEIPIIPKWVHYWDSHLPVKEIEKNYCYDRNLRFLSFCWRCWDAISQWHLLRLRTLEAQIGIAESNMETHVPSHLETEKKNTKKKLWPWNFIQWTSFHGYSHYNPSKSHPRIFPARSSPWLTSSCLLCDSDTWPSWRQEETSKNSPKMGRFVAWKLQIPSTSGWLQSIKNAIFLGKYISRWKK